jgi:hypothetical protein
MAIPVCPTCSLCGRQCASATGRLQASAAPSVSASSSTMPQFSGPFMPRPALTTTSASVSATFPEVLVVPVIFHFWRIHGGVQMPPLPPCLPCVTVNAFTFKAITFTAGKGNIGKGFSGKYIFAHRKSMEVRAGP